MKNNRSLRRQVAAGLAIMLVFAAVSGNMLVGHADPFLEIKEKLSGISEEEKEILQNLFTLSQEIELMELEEKKLSSDVEKMNSDIKSMEAAISEGEQRFAKKRESLRQVLRSYQRMGPGSFLEIILESDSLGTFLQRVNTVRDLTRNTGELLSELEASGEKLKAEKAALSESLLKVEEKRKQAKEALAKKLELRKEQENYLASLKGERLYYQEHLKNIERVWNELKPLFAKAADEFSRIIKEGNIPSEALKVSFSFTEARGAIADSVINKVVEEQSTLPAMIFSFHPGSVEIDLPEKYLMLSGTFVITDGHTLKFQAASGSFYGMPLEPGAIQELFGNGELVLDIEPLLAGNTINDLEIKEGYLELINRYKLF
ncbi:MAG: coiled-coil domain-containing protein [Pseudomonadota bacterium]